MEGLRETVSDSLSKIDEEIKINTQVRVETNGKIREMIENIRAELERKVILEQREREHSQNCLLNLLEESCNKIENFFAQSC